MTYRHAAVAALVTLFVAGGRAAAQATKSDAKSAPSAEASAIIAQEKSMRDALTKNDIAAFNKGLGSNFVYVDPMGEATFSFSRTK